MGKGMRAGKKPSMGGGNMQRCGNGDRQRQEGDHQA